MAKTKTKFVCRECGYETVGYMGKCPSCQQWNTIEEVTVIQAPTQTSTARATAPGQASLLKDIKTDNSKRIQTGIREFDRVMGGGIVRDSVTILTAKPGAGKSTLLLQVAAQLEKGGHKVLYASGEESESQIKSRADRILDKVGEHIYVLGSNHLEEVLATASNLDVDFLIVDSIQTMASDEMASRPGSPTQTMACANGLVQLAKNPARPRVVFMVGQMTKEDELAGVRSLEHLVDTVLMMSTDEEQELRMLMATKNRYGSTGEVGFFEMTEAGMKSIDNPSSHFMTARTKGQEVIGCARTVIKEGTRPIILEVESLVSQSFTPYPSRVSESLRREQLNTLVSLAEQRGHVNLFDKNVVVKTAGGIRLREPSANLAVIMSIISGLREKSLPMDTVFLADVSLTGELRSIPMLTTRLKEADRMGFARAFVAKGMEEVGKGLRLTVVPCLTLLDVAYALWPART